MDELIERYKSASGEQAADGCGDQRMDPKQEAMVLQQEINLLQKGLRYIYGNRANEHMTVEELNALERYLEIWMYNIRSAKMQIMIQEIQALKSKASMLKAANEILQEKIVEQNGLIDVGMMVSHQQNGHFSTVPLIEEITNPLTILSGYSTCRGSEMGYSF
ncbi:hypothetical protein ABZP36_027159 [Zizania latifolia]